MSAAAQVSGWAPSTTYLGSADWLKEALAGLERLAGFRQDWDGYGSPAVTKEAVGGCRLLLLQAARSQFSAPEIRPVSGGGLQLEWRSTGRELEVGVLPRGEVEVLAILDGNQMVQEELGTVTPQVVELLPEIFKWVFVR